MERSARLLYLEHFRATAASAAVAGLTAEDAMAWLEKRSVQVASQMRGVTPRVSSPTARVGSLMNGLANLQKQQTHHLNTTRLY